MAKTGDVKVNDLVLRIATVNGTGSSSANNMLMKALFRMGLPVSGRNIFPSNIQGLPTWYEIRINDKGYTGRSEHVDILIGMNSQTYKKDIDALSPGGIFLYDSTWPLDKSFFRDDVTFIGVPLAKMCVENFKVARLRILMKNITYVGALAALLDIDLDVIKQMLQEKFAKKQALIASNMEAINLGYDYIKEHAEYSIPYKVEKRDLTKDSIMIDGNAATGLGAVYAGATVGAWYPITPSTSVMDNFEKYCKKFRKDSKTDKYNYIMIQAEDELAAAGMVIGANWNGARSFTATSGAGISLMTEFIGYAYFTETPAVFVNVQRAGPSTGLPTRTQQGDFLACAYASHGDTKHIMLIPSDPSECFEFSVKMFDVAERFQTPVFLMSDLDIGMNDWVVPKLEWDDSYIPDRGKVLSAEEIDKLDEFYRYMDYDGDGICARTIPGVHPKGAYFTRGSGHNKYGRYTEVSDEYGEVMERLNRKFETAKKYVPSPEFIKNEKATFGIVTVGGCRDAVVEAIDRLAEENIQADFMRIRSFPFSDEVEGFISKYEKVFVVEQNRDAQLRTLIVNETSIPKSKLIPLTEYTGFPIASEIVIRKVKDQL